MQLAFEYPPDISRPNFLQRLPADGGDRLRASIAARADEKRNEEGERHHGVQLPFKEAQYATGQSFGQEEKQQPAYARAHHAPDTRG